MEFIDDVESDVGSSLAASLNGGINTAPIRDTDELSEDPAT